MMIATEPAPDQPYTTDARIPPRDAVVSRLLLEKLARERGAETFAVFDDNGERWSFADLYRNVTQTALGLQQLGVGMGDHILVWMKNSRENLRIFFALGFLGAVYVPVNTAYQGRLLEHVIRLSHARLAVVDAALCARLQAVDPGRLEHVVVVGEGAVALPVAVSGYRQVLLPERGTLRAPPRAIEPWDPMAIIFTSGTTGPSKAVLMSYLHMYTNAGPGTWNFVTGEDRFMIQAPMFHIAGMGPIYIMLAHGGSIAFLDRFSTDGFWRSVRHTRTTIAFLLGAMATFLEKAPPHPDDRAHTLRTAVIVPLPGSAGSFRRRFGTDVYTLFNMTEISSPIISDPNPAIPGTCGRQRPGVEVRLVDANDCEVPVGDPGEMIIRTDRPWGMNSGYFDNFAATATAWRNGWFHTGDVFKRDADGNFFFLDRLKDVIRRRGENISSLELEAEIIDHPDVVEAAAIGVPSEVGEDDIMVCVALRAGSDLSPQALIAFLTPRIARFMLPRYIRTLPELPKTPTAKVMKHDLRKAGVTADTWERPGR